MSSGYSAKYVAVPVWQSEASAGVAQKVGTSGPPVMAEVARPLIPEKSGIRLW